MGAKMVNRILERSIWNVYRCEIGVYSTEGPDLNIPGVFNGTFYYCVDDEDLLEMSYTLYKKDKVLFRYHDIHWWLTGFSLGEFSEPSDL